MKKLIIRYKHGKTPFIYRMASASMVQQVLTAITAELVEVCGSYKWTLDGYTGQYKIVASWKNRRWTDAQGKTPGECLYNFIPARNILERVYGISKA